MCVTNCTTGVGVRDESNAYCQFLDCCFMQQRGRVPYWRDDMDLIGDKRPPNKHFIQYLPCLIHLAYFPLLCSFFGLCPNITFNVQCFSPFCLSLQNRSLFSNQISGLRSRLELPTGKQILPCACAGPVSASVGLLLCVNLCSWDHFSFRSRVIVLYLLLQIAC